MENFHLLLHAHWGLERFSIFDLQLPIPNWAAIENWKLEIDHWVGSWVAFTCTSWARALGP